MPNKPQNIILIKKNNLVGLDIQSIEAIMENMVEGVVVLNKNGFPVLVNESAKLLLGENSNKGTQSDFIMKKFSRLGIGASADRVMQNGERVISVFETDLPEVRSVKYVISPIINKAKILTEAPSSNFKTIGCLVVLRDVTEEVNADRIKTEIVSTVSHELRTPLSIIKEGVELVYEGAVGQLEERQKEVLGSVRENVIRLSRIINSLLDISKIEAGRIEIVRSFVDINQVATMIVDLHKTAAQKQGLEIKLAQAAEQVIAYCDEEKILRVLTNLVANAIKFTPTGGSVVVSVKDLGQSIECAVVDSGIGISSTNLKKLFKKFEQFDRQPGQGEKGTGLGLAITKELVTLHGGEMQVESEVGKGSKFIFVIPKNLGRELLIANLDFDIKRQLRQRHPFSLIILPIINLKQSIDASGLRSLQLWLQELGQQITKQCAPVVSVLIVLDEAELYIALPGMPKEDALVLEGEIKQLVKEFVETVSSQPLPLVFNYAAVSAPEDGTKALDLIRLARRKAKK